MSVFVVFSCRFLIGGDHGRLKFLPPEDFSPLVESLLPQQILSIDPCFYFGNLNKNVLAGPLFVEDDTAFVPVPVDTSSVMFILGRRSICILIENSYFIGLHYRFVLDRITQLRGQRQGSFGREHS